MSEFIRSRQKVLLPWALLLFSLLLISRQSYRETRARPSWFARGLVSTVSVPQRAISYSVQALARVWRNYFYLVGLREQNLRLQKEVALLQEGMVQAEEYRRENERLRSLLGFKEEISYQVEPARVIGGDLLAESKTLTLNKGALDGVQAHTVVVAAGGVVGQILDEPGSRLGFNTAQVLLIIDRNSRVDALVQRSRARGVLRGTGDPDRLELQYVERTADVVVGDVVVCSGMGGIFPKGLMLGTVRSVASDPNELSLHIEVAPAVDFSRLEEVLLVLPGTEP